MEQGELTWAVGKWAHEWWQHFYCCSGVRVFPQALHHLSLEASHHVQQDIVRETHVIQVPVNLERWKVLLRRHAGSSVLSSCLGWALLSRYRRTLLCVRGRFPLFLQAEKAQELPSHLHWFSSHQGCSLAWKSWIPIPAAPCIMPN